MAVMYHPIPALDPMLPQHSLLSSRSHPPCLIPPPSNRRCCRAGKVSHFVSGPWQIAGTKQIAVSDEKQHCHETAAAGINHLENCFRLGRKRPEAGAAGMETESPWSLLPPGDSTVQATQSPRTCSRERSVVPSTPPSPSRYLGTLTKVKEEVRASLCKYKV